MGREVRDEFIKNTKETLAKRVGYLCSNPDCRKITLRPHSDDDKSVSVGVAAHISAAAPGGARYDSTMTSTERKNIKNGIWLCQTCGNLIDKDEPKYSKIILEEWKRKAEEYLANITLEKEFKSAKKVISKMQDIEEFYEYVYQYYIANFEHYSNFEEAMMALRQYQYLHVEGFKPIEDIDKLVAKTKRKFSEIKLDINPEASELIKEYFDLLKFSYESDDIGIYNDYIERFLENLITSKTARANILKSLKNYI